MTLDASLIGAGSAVALLDDGTGGDDILGDGIYSANVIVAMGTGTGTKSMPVTLTNGANSGGTYIAVEVKAATTPDNDNCSSATAIAGPYTPPVTVAGNFTGATVEYNEFVQLAGSPSTGMSTRRGLWYTVTGTGTTMTASLCATAALDSVMIVMAGTCDGLTVITSADDNGPACAGTPASASWCSVLGSTYWIWVAPFTAGAQTAAFSMAVSENGISCTGAVPTTVCAPDLSPTTLESEPSYGPGTDDGCDSSPLSFRDITVSAYPANTILRGTSRGYAGNRDTDWYRFQAPITESLTVTMNAQFNGILELRQVAATDCSINTLVTSSPISARCAPLVLTSGVTAGNYYAVRVIPVNLTSSATFGGVAVGGYSYHYRLDIQLAGPPVNDTCAGAITLALGATATGNTAFATNDGTSTCDANGRDLWYTITTTAMGTFHAETCGSAIDTVLTLYSVCGGAEITCNDDCSGCPCFGGSSCLTVTGLPPGTYRLRVSDKLFTAGAFVVRASLDATANGNDACCDAIPITCGSVTVGTTVAASAETPLPPACAGPLPGGSQSFAYTNGVWYRISSPITQTITVDTLASAYDSKLWVFDASAGCGSLTCVTANDDIQGSPFQSKVAWVAQAGVDYRILVAPFTTTTGSFTLTASCDPTPVNDLCIAPQVLAGTSGAVAGTTVGATAFTNTSTTANPSCNASYSMFAVWYQYTSPCNTNATFATCGPYNTQLSVHSACPTPTVSNQLAGACNLDGSGGCAPGSIVTVALSSGQTVLIRVAGELGAQPGSPFTLTYSIPDTDFDGTPDCFDGCPSDPNKIAPGDCGCGTPDTDSDLDGTPDCFDDCPNDPNKIDPGDCGCGIPDIDSDLDGTPDCIDGCPDDPNKIAAGDCGCGVPDIDSDGDGTADCVDGCPDDPDKIDPGDCGCGVPDIDSDGDGTADCVDGCPDDPNKIDPGDCGCGVPDLDSDGDGTLDCFDGCPDDPNKIDPGDCGCGVPDLDSDGDGTLDCFDGCPDDPNKTDEGLCGCGIPDTDTDSDGVPDCIDNCPTVANLGQEDGDLDGVGDLCDNCPSVFNPGQEDCDRDGTGDACAGRDDCNGNGIPDSCEPDCNDNGVPDDCDIADGTSMDLNLNGIPDECEGIGGTPFCFGDGTGNGCPCANFGGSGEGCANSTGSGAQLYNIGGTSVSADDAHLVAIQVPANEFGIMFMGPNQVNGGLGIAFGDGHRCVGGHVRRFPIQDSGPGGAMVLVNPVAQTGAVITPGSTFHFQAWHRDTPISPCGTLFNLSNGFSVTFTP